MECTDVRTHRRSLLPKHITLCLFELNFICLQVVQSSKVFKCIRSFLQTSLVFISQNQLEPVEISGKRLSGDYGTIAPVIFDQAADTRWPGGKARDHSYLLVPFLISWPWREAREPVVVFAAASGTCRCLCFHGPRGGGMEAPLAGSVGEVCYIRAFCLSEMVFGERRGSRRRAGRK